jgi:hypothetical protein
MKRSLEVLVDMGKERPVVLKILDATFYLSIKDANELAGSLIRAVNLVMARGRKKK